MTRSPDLVCGNEPGRAQLDSKVYAYGTRVYVSQLFTVEGM